MMKRRTFMVGSAVLGLLGVASKATACPPPKYKKNELVEVKATGVRLFVLSSKVKNNQNYYSLSASKGGSLALNAFEKQLTNVSK